MFINDRLIDNVNKVDSVDVQSKLFVSVCMQAMLYFHTLNIPRMLSSCKASPRNVNATLLTKL